MASGGTVRDYPRMNAQEDAEVLEKAMKGMGMSVSYCMHFSINVYAFIPQKTFY